MITQWNMVMSAFCLMLILMCFWAACVVETQNALQRNVIIILIADQKWIHPWLSGKFFLPDATCPLTRGGGRTLHKCRCCPRCVFTRACGFAGRKILGRNSADQPVVFRRLESSRTFA